MPHDPSHSGQDAPPCRRYADRPDTQYARSSSSVPIGCMDSPINDYRNIFTEQACLSRHPHQSQNLAVLTPPFFVGDVIDQLEIGRTAFYRYFPTDRIRQLRAEHSESAQT